MPTCDQIPSIKKNRLKSYAKEWNETMKVRLNTNAVEQRRGKENERIEMESTKSGEKNVFRKIKIKICWVEGGLAYYDSTIDERTKKEQSEEK